MHCYKCKTVIDKAVMIIKTVYGTEEDYETHYCKKCFKREFINE